MAGFAVKYKAQPKAILTDPDKKRPDSCMCLGFVQKQVPDRRRNDNKTTLTLTLSRPTGEGTARPVSQSGWIRRPTEDDSPSPIRWERAGVRVILLQNPKLFLRESLLQQSALAQHRCHCLVHQQVGQGPGDFVE